MIIPRLETQELNIETYAERFKGNTYDESIILLGLKLPKEPVQDPLDYEQEDMYYLDPWAMGASVNTASYWNYNLETTGRALPVIITGGTTAGPTKQTNEATEMARYMVKYFPQIADSLIMEDEAKDTLGNAENSNLIIEDLVKAKVLSSKSTMYVLTRPDHAPRARDIFANVGYRNLTETTHMPYMFTFLDELKLANELLYYYENNALGSASVNTINYQLQKATQQLVEEVYHKRLKWPGILEKTVLTPMNDIPFTRPVLDIYTRLTRH
jgi:uncharacterized SAM-binding protein YcdF (DUF218 family)